MLCRRHLVLAPLIALLPACTSPKKQEVGRLVTAHLAARERLPESRIAVRSIRSTAEHRIVAVVEALPPPGSADPRRTFHCVVERETGRWRVSSVTPK
jgi:hypothetical protein